MIPVPYVVVSDGSGTRTTDAVIYLESHYAAALEGVAAVRLDQAESLYVLLHELRHVKQQAAGESYSCPASEEDANLTAARNFRDRARQWLGLSRPAARALWESLPVTWKDPGNVQCPS